MENKLKTSEPLSLLDKAGYGTGAFGANLLSQSITIYFLYFYTDVFGLSAAVVGVIFSVMRCTDLLSDLLVGYLVDHTNTRWGRFRPYLLFGAVPLGGIFIVCFSTPNYSLTGKIVYACITQILLFTSLTFIFNPYSTLLSVITQDTYQRSKLSAYRITMVGAATLIVSVTLKPFVNLFPDEQSGFQWAMVIFALLSIIALWICFYTVKERVPVRKDKYRVQEIFKLIINNKMLLIIGSASFLSFSGMHIKNGAVIYHLKYNLEREQLISLYFAITMTTGFLGVLFAPVLSKTIGKRDTMILGCTICTIVNLLLFFVPHNKIVMMFILSAIHYISSGLFGVLAFSMVADTVEYGEWKTGKRTEGIVYAFFTFCLKLSIAASGALSALVLFISGYVPNTVQSAQACIGINVNFSLLVSGVSFLSIIIIWFYGLDDELHSVILKEIKNSTNNEVINMDFSTAPRLP